MKLPLDPSHFDMPSSLATYIIGAAVSALGIVAAPKPSATRAKLR